MAKLTLSIDERMIARAKRLAAQKHTSVSELFSQFIESITGKNSRTVELGPLTRTLSGIVPTMTDKECKNIITDELMKKYKL
jgi:hypothetical protein